MKAGNSFFIQYVVLRSFFT